MCYFHSGYVIFTLRKLKFYGGQRLRAGDGSDVRAEGWGVDNPNTLIFAIIRL